MKRRPTTTNHRDEVAIFDLNFRLVLAESRFWMTKKGVDGSVWGSRTVQCGILKFPTESNDGGSCVLR